MNELILAVDDEPLLLRSYRRTLGEHFNLATAEGPEAALDFLRANEVAVILSDLKMPGMDGVTFLQAAREVRPEAVRMIISGHADMSDAINSVNHAGIFRLMLKPCPEEQIAHALIAGVEQYRLIHAERQLLDGTLNGAIQTLTDILGMLDPEVYGEAQLRRRLAREVALALKQPTWTFEISALLAEIGRATLPPLLTEKLKAHQALSEGERRILERVPEFSSRLLKHIPRIDAVVQAVLYQDKHFNGSGFPADGKAGADIPIAARMLHAVNALQELVKKGTDPADAIDLLRQGPERYDPDIVRALYSCIPVLRARKPAENSSEFGRASLASLVAGMVLLTDIVTAEGVKILAGGTCLTNLHIQRVRNYAQLNPVAEPILVELRAPAASTVSTPGSSG